MPNADVDAVERSIIDRQELLSKKQEGNETGMKFCE